MIVVRTAREMALWSERYRAAGLSVGFVPTMGALHEGHVSLLLRARDECERVVASIFVNPTQFGPGEDLAAYPSTPDEDLRAASEAGADLLFLGSPPDMYPEGYQTWVTVEGLTRPLCGAVRPGHFRGVTTVVAQLLHLVRPHRAYFGLKDYQQALAIERMARDLHLDVEIVKCPTVREADGLAMSSRNVYLGARARAAAPRIYRALVDLRDLARRGDDRVEALRLRLVESLAADDDLQVEYAEVLDADTLEEFPDGTVPPGASILAAVAARVGTARLIDNIVVPASSRHRGRSEGGGCRRGRS